MPERTEHLAALDHAHVWHPFTPMRQWRQAEPIIIERGEGPFLFDTRGNRYLDGMSSLWCNVHGHGVPAIDHAIRVQLDKVAHTTLLGLASPPSIELAARLVALASGQVTKWPSGQVAEERSDDAAAHSATGPLDHSVTLSHVFYSDAGATAVEVAFKMAVGYWFHRGRPAKNRFIGMSGAYHGDTTGSMSVGYCDLFHRPYRALVFEVDWFPAPYPSQAASESLATLGTLLEKQAERTAAIVLEPVMQGAAGMIPQPPGFVRAVAELARQHEVLLIADEVATGFGRTGEMFACQHDGVTPDILCLGKGITGGYLPLAATLCTDGVAAAFEGEPHERKTLYHGHTYTGNALACAAALASLDLFASTHLLDHIRQSAAIMQARLDALRGHPHVADIRQRGIMAGIEIRDDAPRDAAALCLAMRPRGLLLRPLGDVLVLMPIPAMGHERLSEMLDIVVAVIEQ